LYNDAVTIYNTRIDSIPDLFAARLLRFRPEPLFKVAEEEKQVVQVRV
ncbi:LemA family protein, partial [Candidatus Micrarchaeota archaeon]|nr:LemA family protein [Candidatus Micrarchaeota archaeon]